MDAYLATYVDCVMADQDYQNGIFSPTLYERRQHLQQALNTKAHNQAFDVAP